jgi:uncharacterized protein (DUF2236 family)
MLSRSIAGKVNRETVVLLGWGRAVLLQFAHPLVAAGVAEHSPFRLDLIGYLRRMRRTVGAMLSLTFAPEEQVQAVIDRINGIHARIHGTLREGTRHFPAGTPYSAEHPDLLLWVHATLIESNLLAYERFVGPLTDREKDGYCLEAVEIAVMLGVPRSRVPSSHAELNEYLERMLAGGRIEVTLTARRLAGALLSPPLGLAAPLFHIMRLSSIGMLPADVRRQYEFAWSEKHAQRFARATSLIRRVRPLLPRAIREWKEAGAARPSSVHAQGSADRPGSVLSGAPTSDR